jgi:exonuclease SbcD
MTEEIARFRRQLALAPEGLPVLSSATPMGILFVGDIHLGRRPIGLEPAFASAGLNAHQLSPAAAWRATVRHAIESRVRAVVLAGDVVDAEKDRFEAYTHLEEGVRELAESARIPVLGVAGNHDVLVLPRLADRIPGFRLLGRGGQWECVALDGDGTAVDLLGWSFPRPAVYEDPLDHPSLPAALAARRAGVTLLGFVHGDLGAARSPYAPLDPRKLAERPAAAWLLGHVHRPHDLSGDRPIGYLGSLTGLDAGEAGAHGPWTIEVEGGRIHATQMPLAPIRWENLDVPLDDGAIDADAVHARICTGAQARADDPAWADPQLRCVVARVRLIGSTRAHDAARAYAAVHQPDRNLLQIAGRPWILERVVDATRAPIDLIALAAEPTPAGRVAARILDLERGEASDLVAHAEDVARCLSTGRWETPGEAAADPHEALREAAWRALETLLAHRVNRGAA